ncbi:MAG: hypothetical protein M1831_001874 [Alyxoria varia]|nr:MAG: hypothetical protein M1831_001874 [Alyxoria varia]
MHSPESDPRNVMQSPKPNSSSPRRAPVAVDGNGTISSREEESMFQRLEDQPLLSPPAYDDIHREVRYEDSGSPTSAVGESSQANHEDTKGMGYLFLLALPVGGLQVAWSVELSSISPFLLSLGLSKSLLALVWVAGPLSGALVQPYIGIRSDNCRHKWGRRRPFIAGGTVATVASLLALAWTQTIVGSFLVLFGISRDSHATAVASQIWATLLVYVLDFAINVIQAGIRAYIVDSAPTHQQESANAMAGIITGAGSIVGYLFGYADLPKLFPFLGHTEFQVLCAIASAAMILTVAVSCLSIPEKDPQQFGAPSDRERGVIGFFKSLFFSIRRLPPQVRRVCIAQIFAWIGWFPFLFYITTYVGGIYSEPYFRDDPDLAKADIDQIYERGTRMGTLALLSFSITTLVASIGLPMIVEPSFKPADKPNVTQMTPNSSSRSELNDRSSLSISAKRNSPLLMSSRFYDQLLRPIVTRLRISWLTLRRAWLLSHLLFAALMWLTVFVRTTTGATVLISAIGIPWALTNWAPFALISAEISKRDAIRRGVRRPPPTREGQLLAEGGADEVGQAGVVLGIHNMAVSAPQVIATVVSSVIFKFLQKPRGTPGDNSVAWVLRFGGLCTLMAAWCTSLILENDDED